MTTLSLKQAAELAGVSKSTIFRAITRGRLSGPRDDDGNLAIDPAELLRVYPAKPGRTEQPERDATEEVTQPRIRNASLETEVRLLRERGEELRSIIDRHLSQPKPAQLPAPAWWPFGKRQSA